MKKIMKAVAVVTLSACVMTGGALASFAAEASPYRITGYKASTCGLYDGGHCDNAVVTANYTAPDGTVKSYDFCAECGKVNDKAVMTEITDSFSAYGQLYVYTGTLDNGEKMMTVTCLSGQGAMDEIDPRVRIANEAVQGYDLYLVAEDGTETKLAADAGRYYTSYRVPMEKGAALIHMVAQNS